LKSDITWEDFVDPLAHAEVLENTIFGRAPFAIVKATVDTSSLELTVMVITNFF